MSGGVSPKGGADGAGVESAVREIGEKLASSFPAASRQPLKALDARAMEMASSDRELRAALFRFVDVVPACRSLDDLARHLMGFLEEVPETPPPLSVAMKMSGTRAGRAALGAAAAGGVRHLAHRFIVGETPNAALGTLRKLWERGVASSVDLLGEATVTESEADRYAGRCLEAIEQLSSATRGWPSREPPLTVRLVKGAYWDHELVQASQHGWEVPVFQDKRECDRNFEALTRELLAARPALRVAVASHNLRSVAHAIACNRVGGGDDRDLELQVLRGLGDDLQHALAVGGYRVRTYCPVGDLVAGMAYLVRRLLENTSNESFLSEQARGVPLEQLLAAP